MQSLESALVQAAQDPAARPEFYRILLESEVYVIGTSNGEGNRVLAPGAGISLMMLEQADGTKAIPFFSSMDALERVLAERTGYLVMPARAFFEMTRGAMLVLNPGYEHGKEFFPNEVASLLDSGLNRVPEERHVHEATQVQLGPPAEHPVAMVEALSRLLAKHPMVNAAYLCVMHDPSADDHPTSLVVGLEGDGDLLRAIREAASVVGDTAPAGAAVDFAEIKRGQPGLAAHMFTSVTPFYQRRPKRGWRASLLSLVGAGGGR
jgi:hypothetical protein